ncbi:MAG: amidohydrolase family protein [Myxococcales bacterium]|nr:D-aminoacylase [Myxococcales bacterium]HIK84099.1 D-aminoacylase [Myxococcales bacterium]
MLDYLIKGATIVDGTGAPKETGDLGVRDGKIVARGHVDEAARETIDADGALATPGWVDVHTHYDGQVTWDDQMDPSASHGVTTVVMGNCGVGFAPALPGGEDELIDLMEGVEDIPGTALHEGMPWGAWESFPEYMDFLATREYALDVGAQLAHGALRNYVMGQRGRDNEDPTAEDMAEMTRQVEEAMRAGALGFTTSRTIGHRSMGGVPVPGTFAEEDELLALAEAMQRVGSGVFELIPASTIGKLEAMGGEKKTLAEEFELIRKIGRVGRPVTFTTLQIPDFPDDWRSFLKGSGEENAKGSNLRPQVASRPIGLVTSIQTYHMFSRRETYMKIAHLPLDERIREMSKSEVRSAILKDSDIPVDAPGAMANVHSLLSQVAPFLFPINSPIDYEPDPSGMFGALAAAENKNIHEFVYDFLIQNGGQSFAIVLGSNYLSFNHDVIRTMLMDPNTVTGLSDAGAHVNLIFDAVAPTYQLTHWVRDRSRGERLPLEFIVEKQSRNNAELYGLHDRGTLEIGKRADLNLIDFENLQLGKLEVRNDLPAGGSRILQSATGYLGTWVNGVRTRANDVDTGARPGRLVRASV